MGDVPTLMIGGTAAIRTCMGMPCRRLRRFLYLLDCGLASLLVCNIHTKNFQDNCNTVITVIVITVIEITVMAIL